MKNFTKDHLAMALKYLGVSFITGSLSHGFFTGPRAIAFAVFGIISFIAGTLLEKSGKDGAGIDIADILLSSILAIAIGAFTGGLQHFVDSPERSLYIAPLGFILSLVGFTILHGYVLKTKDWIYMAISSVVIAAGSYAFFLAIPSLGLTPAAGHGADGGHGETDDGHGSETSMEIPEEAIQGSNQLATETAKPIATTDSHTAVNDDHAGDDH